MSNVLSERPLTFDIDPSLLEDRWDSPFFKPEYLRALDKVLNSGWPTRKLDRLSKRITQGPNPKKWSEDGIPCLKTKNLYSDRWVFDDLDCVPIEEYEKLKNFTLQYNDILVAIVGFGSTGKVNIFKESGTYIFTRALGLIRLRDDEIIPDFLAIFLDTKCGQTLIDRGVTGSTGQLIITTSYFKDLIIPIPPIEIQKKVIQIVQNAYNEREAKLDRAKELLNSVNDIVLEELGVKLPEIEDKKIFEVEPEDLEDRLDPRYYNPKYIVIPEELKKCLHRIKILKEISEEIVSGATPKAKGDAYTTSENGIPFIRIVDIKNGTIDLSNVLYIKREVHEGMLRRTQLTPNDVLLSMAGTIGVAIVVPENLEEGNINQALARIVLKKGINPHYLAIFLNSEAGRLQTERLCRPVVQANINLAEIRSIKIPIPLREIQGNIVEKMGQIREEAQRLKQEGDDVVKNAKHRVEQIILKGEDLA